MICSNADERKLACHRDFNATTGECSEGMFDSTRKQCCCYENIGSAWGDPCAVSYLLSMYN